MPEIWTIGHSTRSLEDFVELLNAAAIEALADVRRFPGSRRFPHFSQHALAEALEGVGVDYHGYPELGGRRQPRPDSRNTTWRVAGFRGYADYMETEEFAGAASGLQRLAEDRRTAVMCAEALWWRCHRMLIADWLKVRGVTVTHIVGRDKLETHPYSTAARIKEGRLDYEGGDDLPLLERRRQQATDNGENNPENPG